MDKGKKRAYDAGESDSQSSRKTQHVETYPATPELHAAMDKAIMGDPSIGLYLGHPLATFGSSLIALIVEKADPELLDQKYLRLDEAGRLLATKDGLFDELQKGWDAKSFACIRNLGQTWHQYLELKESN
jgi:hypothetical protein